MRSIETSKEFHATERAFIENNALMLRAVGIGKTFTLHGQGGVQIESNHRLIYTCACASPQ